METVIGTIAATLTTVCFIPQVVKVLRERDAKAISLPMYALFTLGLCFWLAYGVMLHSWPIIIANVITLGLALVILVMKIRLG